MKKGDIRTVSYVHTGGGLVNTDDLDDRQCRELAAWLKRTYLNALFQGEAVFQKPETSAEREARPGF